MKLAARMRKLGLGSACVFGFSGAAGTAHAATPAVSVANAAEYEGQTGFTLLAFQVTLSVAGTGPASVNYSTANGTALSGSDYSAISGVLVFPAGQTSRTVLVPVAGDASIEPDETLTLTLSNPVGVTFAQSQATGTIKNDDPLGEATAITLYRLYSPITLEHHFTTDANEYVVLGTMGWQQEGAGYAMYLTPGTHKGVTTVPVFRLYHDGIRQHFWTTDWFEVTVLVAGGTWVYEGIPGYVLPSATSDSIPVFRLSLANPPLHLWTTDAHEQFVLSTQRGWVAEGAMGYVQKAETITTAAGITGSDGKVLLTVLGQPLSFRLVDTDNKPQGGLAVGIGIHPTIAGIGFMVISHPQDAFVPRFRILVSAPTSDNGFDSSSPVTGNEIATTVVQFSKKTADGLGILKLVGVVNGFPPLLENRVLPALEIIGPIQGIAQSMNTMTNGQAGALIAKLPGATRTTMTVDQAVAQLRADNTLNGIKGGIIVGVALVPPIGTAAALAALPGACLDLAQNFYAQNTLLNCPKRGDGADVTVVTFLGESIYACAQAPDLATQVSGLLRFPSTDPKSGGSLHLIGKGSFGVAFQGVIGGDGTVSYSVPAGDYDAVAIAPYGSTSTTTYSTLTIPAGGGERNVPPRTCNLAEYNANYSACLAVSKAEYLVCDATFNFVTQTGQWAACYGAVEKRFSACLEKCTVPH
jgi:hypothetical protein